jgi:type II secretory pathway pseudopilin PulG
MRAWLAVVTGLFVIVLSVHFAYQKAAERTAEQEAAAHAVAQRAARQLQSWHQANIKADLDYAKKQQQGLERAFARGPETRAPGTQRRTWTAAEKEEFRQRIARAEGAVVALQSQLPSGELHTSSLLPMAKPPHAVPPISKWNAFQPFLVGLAYYLITLLGIVTGSIYEALEKIEGAKKIRVRVLLKHAVSAGSWRGLLASPIIFAVIKAAIPEGGLTFSMFLLSYQNGFFWRSTLKKLSDAQAKE